jgi:hypothetical protein
MFFKISNFGGLGIQPNSFVFTDQLAVVEKNDPPSRSGGMTIRCSSDKPLSDRNKTGNRMDAYRTSLTRTAYEVLYIVYYTILSAWYWPKISIVCTLFPSGLERYHMYFGSENEAYPRSQIVSAISRLSQLKTDSNSSSSTMIGSLHVSVLTTNQLL